jgi:hypothetical protein
MQQDASIRHFEQLLYAIQNVRVLYTQTQDVALHFHLSLHQSTWIPYQTQIHLDKIQLLF